MVAYTIDRRMLKRAEYLQEEVRVLREALANATGTSRIRFTPEQRRRLATKGKALTPKEREESCQIVRPATILAWFRQLTARAYNGSTHRRPPGRPRKAKDIRDLVVRIAHENLGWGYTKIRDALRGLRVKIGRPAVATMLAEAGLDPAPERKRRRTWKHFFASHWDTLYACDFFAVETLGAFCSVRLMVFFVIELRTCAAHIAGIRIDPDGAWMQQVARQLLDPTDGFLRYATYRIHGRDPLFTAAWTTLLESGGVSSVPIPASSPNCNPHAERFVKTVREECLDQLVTFGEKHLRHLLREFVAHYNEERHHQGLGGRLIRPRLLPNNDNGSAGAIHRSSRLRGLLSFYRRAAA